MESLAMEFYRDVCKSMIHLWFKGFVKWSCSLSGNMITRWISAAARIDGAASMETLLSLMADPSCKDMCRVIMDVLVQRFVDKSNELPGTRMPIGNSAAARDGQRHVNKGNITRIY